MTYEDIKSKHKCDNFSNKMPSFLSTKKFNKQSSLPHPIKLGKYLKDLLLHEKLIALIFQNYRDIWKEDGCMNEHASYPRFPMRKIENCIMSHFKAI